MSADVPEHINTASLISTAILGVQDDPDRVAEWEESAAQAAHMLLSGETSWPEFVVDIVEMWAQATGESTPEQKADVAANAMTCLILTASQHGHLEAMTRPVEIKPAPKPLPAPLTPLTMTEHVQAVAKRARRAYEKRRR